MHANLHDLSLCDAARLLKARLISPVELTRTLLGRIELFDSHIHAFITVTAEQALEQARQAEAEIMKGQYRGALHGIPIAYKDNVATKGVRTTAHSRFLAQHVPGDDAEVVKRLAGAGAVSMGKLSLQELAYGSPGADDAFAAPVNPWSLAHSPGGSSSGSGAAVAAGFVYGAVGTDTGGSIRHPAAVCGVVGMKPTFGLVSTHGTIALSPTQDHVGPLTRGVRDNAAMLQAMSGLSACDACGLPAGLRVGVPFDLIESVGLDPSVQAAFDTSVALLKSLGASIIEIPTARLKDFNAIGTQIIQLEAWAKYGAALTETPELFGDAFRARVRRGADFSAIDYRSALASRAAIQHHYEQLFATRIDVIVSPAREEPAMTMEGLLADPLGVRGQLTRVYNLARIPALAMPMGFSPDGLPVSLQIAAAAGAEAVIYNVAGVLDDETGWTRLRPDISRQLMRAEEHFSA